MIKKTEISKISDSDLDTLAELDSKGLLLAPQENIEIFKKRITELSQNIEIIEQALKDLKEFDLEGICSLKSEDKIPQEIMLEASAATKSEYAFEVDWVPGFFMSKSLGPLWGGCSIIIPEINTTVFLIRSAFKKKKRWLLYNRDELLAHELCHSIRMPLSDRVFDENFAYRISPSIIRRHFGGTFRTEFDALIFIAPVFLLLIVQLMNIFFKLNIPIIPFWLLAIFCPAYLIIRNFLASKTLSNAEKRISNAGFSQPYAVLFRCTTSEIKEISNYSEEKFKIWLYEKRENELRWKVIFHRFHIENHTKITSKT